MIKLTKKLEMDEELKDLNNKIFEQKRFFIDSLSTDNYGSKTTASHCILTLEPYETDKPTYLFGNKTKSSIT